MEKNVMTLEDTLELFKYLRNPYEKVAVETIINYYKKNKNVDSEFRAILRTIDNKRFKTEMKLKKYQNIPDIEKDYLNYKLVKRKAIVRTMKHIIKNDKTLNE